jgi:hypothetical protein
VLGYRRWLDEIVRQKFYPAAATRGSLRHRRRADGLRVLDLRGSDSHLQSNLWRRGDRLPPADFSTTSPTGSGVPPAASGASGVNSCIGTPTGMSPPSAPGNKTTRASVPTTTHPGALQLQEGYPPSTTLASGSGASVAGGSVTAWASGAASSTGGATSSPTADEGSSSSQLRSVDFFAEVFTEGRQTKSTTAASTTREDMVLTS